MTFKLTFYNFLKTKEEKGSSIYNMRSFYLIFIIIQTIISQEYKIDSEKLWEGDYEPKRLESILSMKDDNHYTVLEQNAELNSSLIILNSFINPKKRVVLFDSKRFSENLEISSYSFSKDEQNLLLETHSDPIYRRSKQGVYWIYNLKSKELQKLTDEKVQEPTFSPDGKNVAYVYRRNIYVKNLITKATMQLTFDGDYQTINGITDWVYEEEFGFVRAFHWSPDSKKIVFMRFDESNVPIFSMGIYGKDTYPFPYMFRYPKAGETNASVDLFVLELESRIRQPIIFKEKPYYIPRIKFDGGQNTLIIQTINRHQNDLRVFSYNIENKTFRLLINEKDKAYVSIHDDLKFIDDNNFLWTSERDGYKHIYRYDKNGNLINQVTKGNWEVTKMYAYNSDLKEIYYQSVEGSSIERGIFAIKINGKGKRILQPTNGTNGANFSKKGSYYIHSYSDEKTPPKYALYQTRKNKLISELLNNQKLCKRLESYNLSNREFSTLNVNGLNFNMWMIKPDNFDPKKKYPLLMFQYSGPGSQQVSNRWGDSRTIWHKDLANKGYIIACVDGRGTGFKGAEFKKSTYLNLVKYESIDQIEAAKSLGSLSYIDESRIGIWGWSFGGHMAAQCLLTGKEVFSMAIAVAPVTNWRFYDTIYTERFMRTPQENPDGYDLNSPLNYADKLEGKFLIIHGSADDNVHVQNTMRLVEELIQEDKQFEWMIYPDKNHGIFGGNTRRHLYTKMTNFIIENL